MSRNTTFEKFKEQNQKLEAILSKLQNFIESGVKLGVEIDPSVQHKLTNVLDMVGKEAKLKIALVGGFSEGKTSIAAAWMERLDKKSMKISQQESSDAVNIYTVDDEIELIDTPGLFGFKEKYNAELKEIEKYRDITKKYVSEAHLLLYVMDSANPIKESHKDDLLWLFRDLNLLARTVFVLSRFDEVADIEDEWDYQENLKIKKENVIKRLKSMISLTEEEEKQILITGVAANPFGMGTEYWLKNLEQFKEISKIDTLQKATQKAITNNGGYLPIAYEMQKSIVQDVLMKHLPEAKETEKEISLAVDAFEMNCNSLESNVRDIAANIVQVQANLVKALNDYFAGIIIQARGVSLETAQSFVDAEVGKEGCIMYANLQSIFSTQTNTIDVQIEDAAIEFNANVNQFDSTVGKMGKKGLSYLKNSGIINSQNILIARDSLVGLAKMLGQDISGILKFKPWGAVNLAKNIGVALQIVGFLLEIWDAYKRMEAENKLNEAINDFVKDIQETQGELLGLVTSPDFAGRFFPGYVELKNNLTKEKEQIQIYRSKREEFRKWCEEGEAIDVEYRIVES